MFRRQFLDDITIEESRFGVEPEIVVKVAQARCRVFEVGFMAERMKKEKK